MARSEGGAVADLRGKERASSFRAENCAPVMPKCEKCDAVESR